MHVVQCVFSVSSEKFKLGFDADKAALGRADGPTFDAEVDPIVAWGNGGTDGDGRRERRGIFQAEIANLDSRIIDFNF